MDWTKSLENHLHFAFEKLGDKYFVVCLACKGSQNYKLDTPQSDFDSICLVVPRLRTMMTELQPLSTTYELPNGELCKVKDVRLFCRELLKSWTLWEVVFTPLAYWAPEAWSFDSFLYSHLDEYAYFDEYTIMRSVLGEAAREYKNFQKMENVDKRNKAAMKVLRFRNMMEKYMFKTDVDEVVKCNAAEREDLLAVKRGEVKGVAAEVSAAMCEMENMMEFYAPRDNKNTELVEQLFDMCCELFKEVNNE